MHINDVAKKLGVSVATVSRAINPATAHLVAEKTRKRVERFAAEHHYVPNRSASALSTGKTGAIGLVVPNVLESIFFNDYLIKVLAGVYTTLDQDGHHTCKILILPRGKVISDLDRHVLTGGLDGLLLSPYCDPILYSKHFPKNLLKNWDRPTVVLNLNIPSMKRFGCVYIDHKEAARQSVTYLIEKGHRRIGMILGDSFFPEATDRFEGYKWALREHGLAVDEALQAQGNFLVESGYQAALTLFRKKTRLPSALFCANDEMAMGALRALKSLKIACPQDVAVMGFDGLDVGRFVTPRLTSMAQPTKEIAERATRLLIDLILRKKTAPEQQLVFPQLLIRESA